MNLNKMKVNENVKIVGKNVILVPYEAKHVSKYHEWMKDPELQELTASEPLTLEEEYAMQKSWRQDEDKCTFLILSKDTFRASNDEIEALIGDTNLFITEDNLVSYRIAEAEIMIAESSFRGQRLGWEAMLLMLNYGVESLDIKEYVVKVSDTNVKSIKMFEKMHFKEISRSQVFKEITMKCPVTDEWNAWLRSNIVYTVESYH